MGKPCDSYVLGADVCKSGFYQKHPICAGRDYTCPCCKRDFTRTVPQCMRDEIPEHTLSRVQQIIKQINAAGMKEGE